MDYKEKYEQAKERAKEYAIDGYLDAVAVNDIFPELKESEDERIRKVLKEYFINSFQNNGVAAILGVHIKDILAWLEKQGEHKKFRDSIQAGDKVTRNEDGVLVNLSQLKRVAKPADKQGEQKPQRIVSAEAKEAMYDKPAWSKEDEKNLLEISCLIGNYRTGDDEYKLDSWLKSLKDRVQSKQEWSQNDIDMIDWLIRCCEKEHEELCNDKYGHQDIVSDLKRDCRKKWNWLESLKNRVIPKNQWKPSEEQMKALWEVYKGGEDQAALASLYSDLKKLKGE